MVMSYRGGGVGHKSTTRDAVSFFLNDHHQADLNARESFKSEEEGNDADGWEDIPQDVGEDSIDEDALDELYKMVPESDEDEGKSDLESDGLTDNDDDALGPEEGAVFDELDEVVWQVRRVVYLVNGQILFY
ncbi:hypothetical protein CPC08DRAFT_781996 [Agrocybe pediades]|nr:hypothetical protein CPC08DRAFT_781996 [Agrocybe pediades]